MELKLISGSFDKNDAIELISQLINVKMRFHENKINMTQSMDDIKAREKRIIQLQNEMRGCIEALKNIDGKVSMMSQIKITTNE